MSELASSWPAHYTLVYVSSYYDPSLSISIEIGKISHNRLKYNLVKSVKYWKAKAKEYEKKGSDVA